MRILFTACPMVGHVNTLLPLALAAQRAGHTVAVATGGDQAPRVDVAIRGPVSRRAASSRTFTSSG